MATALLETEVPTSPDTPPPPVRRRLVGRIVRLLAVLAVMLGATIAVAPAASAYPSWYVPNGCTAPSIGHLASRNVEFRGPCNRHDVCYDWSNNSRLTCDNIFLNEMRGVCVNRYAAWSWGRIACVNDSNIYYTAVRTFGAPFYRNPWLN